MARDRDGDLPEERLAPSERFTAEKAVVEHELAVAELEVGPHRVCIERLRVVGDVVRGVDRQQHEIRRVLARLALIHSKLLGRAVAADAEVDRLHTRSGKRVAALELARGHAEERLLERDLLRLRVRISHDRDPQPLRILRARVLDVAQAVAVDRDVRVSFGGPETRCAGPQDQPAARVGRVEGGIREAEHAQRDLGRRERECTPERNGQKRCPPAARPALHGNPSRHIHRCRGRRATPHAVSLPL